MKETKSKIMNSLKGIGEYILVKPFIEDEKKLASGLVIQSKKAEKPQRGTVVGLGEGARDNKGKLIPWDVKVGDEVIFKRHAPEEIPWKGEVYLVLKDPDILAVLYTSKHRGGY